MGAPDQLIKALFSQQTEAITLGACKWSVPSEVTLGHVLPDGFLEVTDGDLLRTLPAPWRLLQGEVMLEFKMPGDHMGAQEWLRALLRRVAHDVTRAAAHTTGAPLYGALCFVSPHIPDWLAAQGMTIQAEATGCYRISPSLGPVWWICANELPLEEALLPFLIARSGRARVVFIGWLAQRRDFSLIQEMVRVFHMTKAQVQELLEYERAQDQEGEEALRAFFEVGLEFYGLAEPLRREGQEQGLARVRALLMQTLRVRFNAEEARWAPRLAQLGPEALEALHLRALQASSEDDLWP